MVHQGPWRRGTYFALPVAFATWIAWRFRPPAPLADKLPPPAASALTDSGCDGAPWPKALSFTSGEREAFDRDGFVVLRSFLTPCVVAALVQELRRICAEWPGPMDPKFRCFRSGVWSRSDVTRDFLYHGPVGATVRNLLGVDSVRVQEDGVFVHAWPQRGQPWHTDMDQYGGVFSEFHRRTKGAAVWVALTDIDKEQGGSLVMSRGGPRTNCSGKSGHWTRRQPHEVSRPDPACEGEVLADPVVHSFRAGDAMIWHPWMPHRTQAPVEGGERLSWYARLVEGDAIFCNREYRAKAYNRQASCSHALRPGQPAHHPCFPQISPLLPSEVAQRMAPDWFVPVLQPSPLRDFGYRLGVLLDRLRMVSRGGSIFGPGLEKLACMD